MTPLSIDARTVVAGVVGRPISHSLSPLIHNAWLNAEARNAVYLAFSPGTDRFLSFIDGLRGGVIRGLNVTTPFKERALLAADHRSAAAEQAGAANLLLFQADGRISAYNTDGDGLLFALRRQAPDLTLQGAIVTVLGAGGAARGAVAALEAAGVAHIRIVNRTIQRAESLAAPSSRRQAYGLAALSQAVRDASLVINATASELAGGEGLDLDFTGVAPQAAALDMLYRPLRTRFLTYAAQAGLIPVDGLDMLIGQAAPSYRLIFDGAPPDIDVRSLALTALGEAP